MPKDQLRAIDLYSGVGGWSLGLSLAGIDVIESYEWWHKANQTNTQNNHHETNECDIRELSVKNLPKNIEIVVGSPPCTQFSYSNRGGSGDIADGLKDVEKFLSVIAHLKPRWWAMENVPRVAGIIERELDSGGALSRYKHLSPTIRVLDASEFGVPQKRKRCIVGNFDFDRLLSYRDNTKKITLGKVVSALNAKQPADPIYKIKIGKKSLIDHKLEVKLSDEEERINREMKNYHPVYNKMPFPDELDRAGRTITAVCTRVSRESIVIAAPEKKGTFRRLSIRERALLQGFPINYQFYGDTFSEKLRMVGNAVPPPLAYYIGNAMRGVPASQIDPLDVAIEHFVPATFFPPSAKPDKTGRKYPATRKFRAAIPNLRFGSGVRFELVNSFDSSQVIWKVRFFFGNSKDIIEIPLTEKLLSSLLKQIRPKKMVLSKCNALQTKIKSLDSRALQEAWAHRSEKDVSPYKLVDAIGTAAKQVSKSIPGTPDVLSEKLAVVLSKYRTRTGFEKLLRNSKMILAGLVVGSAANTSLDEL